MKATTIPTSVFPLRTMIPRRCARQGPRHGHPDERLVDLLVGVIATGLEQCRQIGVEVGRSGHRFLAIILRRERRAAQVSSPVDTPTLPSPAGGRGLGRGRRTMPVSVNRTFNAAAKSYCLLTSAD
jgi:hypothetical protein